MHLNLSINLNRMKKLVIILLSLFLAGNIYSQDLPKDVQKVFNRAEKLKKKKEYNQAITAYKEVLRSVEHVPSLISAGDIELYRAKPQHREAYKYYTRAINALDQGIASSESGSAKKHMAKLKEETIPKLNKAKTYVDQFERGKQQKEGGNRLLEDPDLKED